MQKVALITGAARRIGAIIAKTLHTAGMNVAIHYHHSKNEAEALCEELNKLRSNSAITIEGNIIEPQKCEQMINRCNEAWNRLDFLINNASSFYPTKIDTVSVDQWEDLVGSNLKGPFFLSQAAVHLLKINKGCIVNISDIHAQRPLKNYPVYCIAKAGIEMLTKSLARELAPNVRVNAVAPGVILWPEEENKLSPEAQKHIIDRICLKQKGTPQDIADTVLFLLNAGYITGQIIAVDGGRSIKD